MIETWPPKGAALLLRFDVIGTPKGAGSKDAIPLGRWISDGGRRRFVANTRESGVPIVNVVDSSGKDGENWRTDIRAAAAQALDAVSSIEDGPVAVRVTFYGKSPKSRYGTGRNESKLKASADRLPHQSELPDGTKLARALEDALNELVWADDRRVCEMWWSRDFAEGWEHGRPGARVDIYTLPAKVAPAPAPEPARLRLDLDPSAIVGGDGYQNRTEALAG